MIEKPTARLERSKPFIPLSVPHIVGNEWAYVKDCLDTGWVSSAGSYVDRFERDIAARVGRRFGVAAVNGTSALHTALLVAGVAENDDVLVSALTFVAPVNAIRYVGAWPVFIDAEAPHCQMDAAAVSGFLETQCELREGKLVNVRTGRRVSAIIPVHVLGHAADMDAIVTIARQYGLTVIEDASEALGTLYKGEPVGGRGDIACFSFNGNKIITCGGGGMLVTDNEDWAKRAKYLTTQAKDDPVEYHHSAIGYNYRLTNVAAAIGCAQLEQLDPYVADKRRIAANYRQGLRDVPGITPMCEPDWCTSTFWMYTIRVDHEAFGLSARQLLKSLESERIQTRPLWQPMHRTAAHRPTPAITLEVAEGLADSSLSLPCSVGLSEADQGRVIEAIRTAGGRMRKS